MNYDMNLESIVNIFNLTSTEDWIEALPFKSLSDTNSEDTEESNSDAESEIVKNNNLDQISMKQHNLIKKLTNYDVQTYTDLDFMNTNIKKRIMHYFSIHEFKTIKEAIHKLNTSYYSLNQLFNMLQITWDRDNNKIVCKKYR